MKSINNLTAAAYGMHFADQIALVSVPLLATLVFGASPEMIGILVACQTSAHLVGSLPFGMLVDTMRQRTLVIASTLTSIIGFSFAVLNVAIGNVFGFAAAISIAGLGIVLFVLTALSVVPRITPAELLPNANAAMELPRSIWSFGVPLTVGFLITKESGNFLLALAALGGIWALFFAIRLPQLSPPGAAKDGVITKIIEGGRFILKQDLLAAITMCAVLWNVAFTALLVVMVPLIKDVYMIAPGAFGSALASFGFAAIVGNRVARKFSNVLKPGLVLIFGPGCSVAATAILYAIPIGSSYVGICIAFFLLGFGPSMWLIAQNTVRQIVTPSDLLGRVNAVIQTAIYGVRPLGALIGGVVVGNTSPKTGIAVVAVTYMASFAVAFFSNLRNVKSYAELQTQQ